MSKEEKVIDLHRKSIIVDALSSPHCITIPEYFDGMRIRGGVDVAVLTLMNGFFYPHFFGLVKIIDEFYEVIRKNSEKMSLCITYDDIMKTIREGKVAILFGHQDAACIEDDLSLLRILYRLGLRQLQLTYSWSNMLGDGHLERRNAGLSDWGLEVLAEMNRLGIIVDTGHCGDATTMDAIEHSKDPIIISHANARSVYKHGRNKTDEIIKALAEKGGVIGVTAETAYVSNRKPIPNVKDLVNHIDYIANLVGMDYVGWGSDISPRQELIKKGIEKTPKLLEVLYKKMGSEVPWENIPPLTGLEDQTKLVNITRELVARGHSDQEIEKFWGVNLLRVMKRVLK